MGNIAKIAGTVAVVVVVLFTGGSPASAAVSWSYDAEGHLDPIPEDAGGEDAYARIWADNNLAYFADFQAFDEQLRITDYYADGMAGHVYVYYSAGGHTYRWHYRSYGGGDTYVELGCGGDCDLNEGNVLGIKLCAGPEDRGHCTYWVYGRT